MTLMRTTPTSSEIKALAKSMPTKYLRLFFAEKDIPPGWTPATSGRRSTSAAPLHGRGRRGLSARSPAYFSALTMVAGSIGTPD